MYKCILLIRKDLNMTKGKIISQCCHGIIHNTLHSNNFIVNFWRLQGEKIITLKVNDFNTMKNIHNKSIKNNIFSHIVIDKGLTQIPHNTPTVCVIGPDLETNINNITKNLKLY